MALPFPRGPCAPEGPLRVEHFLYSKKYIGINQVPNSFFQVTEGFGDPSAEK
jgi:hypothetical protein